MRAVLTINAGSATLKVGAFEGSDGDGGGEPDRVATVLVERIGSRPAATLAAAEGGTAPVPAELATDHTGALELALDALAGAGVGIEDVAVVGHRVVHGGPRLDRHSVLDGWVRGALEEARALAPLHVPVELSLVDAVTDLLGGRIQVVCLDDAFHRTMPEAARRLPLPGWVDDLGVRRYGFHGLSYESIVHTVGAGDLGRSVIAHLGSGASLAAVLDGRSVGTTMGFTPAGGVVMRTRPGDLDPGVLVHLARARNMDPDVLDHLVNHESGLAGISGGSSDMRDLLASSRPEDALAVEMFCRSVAHAVAALSTDLRGIDSLVFTAGIGERAPAVRREVTDRLAHLGVEVDADANARNARVISTPTSSVRVLVVPTDEESTIARHAARLVPPTSRPRAPGPGA